jgi:hypothetical protein
MAHENQLGRAGENLHHASAFVTGRRRAHVRAPWSTSMSPGLLVVMSCLLLGPMSNANDVPRLDPTHASRFWIAGEVRLTGKAGSPT